MRFKDVPRYRHPWTEGEKNKLAKMVDEGKGLEEIAEALGRSKPSVQNKYYVYMKEKCFRNPNSRQKRWTRNEVYIFKLMYNHGSTLQEIADELGRRYSSVQSRYRRFVEYEEIKPRSYYR